MLAGKTGLIVEVPEAECAVGSLRARLDPVASMGVPAHVTVLFPFVAAAEVDEELRRRLSALFAGIPAFSYCLVRSDWFDTDVLWLAPDAATEFAALTIATWDAFPAYPPYGGEFADIVAHLTIADRAPVDEMREAERSIQAHLPVCSVARSVTLIAQEQSGRWSRAGVFELDAG